MNSRLKVTLSNNGENAIKKKEAKDQIAEGLRDNDPSSANSLHCSLDLGLATKIHNTQKFIYLIHNFYASNNQMTSIQHVPPLYYCLIMQDFRAIGLISHLVTGDT